MGKRYSLKCLKYSNEQALHCSHVAWQENRFFFLWDKCSFLYKIFIVPAMPEHGCRAGKTSQKSANDLNIEC